MANTFRYRHTGSIADVWACLQQRSREGRGDADIKKPFAMKGVTPLVAQRREPHRSRLPGWLGHLAGVSRLPGASQGQNPQLHSRCLFGCRRTEARQCHVHHTQDRPQGFILGANSGKIFPDISPA